MTDPLVIGLDLSSTCAGICLPDGSTAHYKPKGELLRRAINIRDWLSDWALPADLVVIEAIGTQQVSAAIALAYVHCLVDLRLRNVRVVKLEPKRLKKFATGRGNADKFQMGMAASKLGWQPNPDSTDDESDAWHLWAFGRALIDAPVVPETAFRTEVLTDFVRGAA